jgi:hypothetical protein
MVEVYRERYARRGETPTSRWTPLDDQIFPSYYGDKKTNTPLDGRNYDLFALLADVRNGTGFAGVKRCDPIRPLAPPRGVPEDASYAWLAEVDGWGIDMHSHSYFTLAELIAFEAAGLFDQEMVRTGAISDEAYEEIKRTGEKPSEWSGSVGGFGIQTLTVEAYEAGSRAEITADDLELAAGWQRRGNDVTEVLARKPRTYVQYVWTDTLTDSVKELRDAIAALIRYAADLSADPSQAEPGWYGHGGISHDRIRIVFGFDN